MLPEENRLLRRSDFTRVYRRGSSCNCPCFRVYSRPTKGKASRIGFSVSKKVGKAHVRNLIKRRFRHAVRELLPEVPPGRDYVIVVYESALELSYAELKSEIRRAMSRCGKAAKKEASQKQERKQDEQTVQNPAE